MKIGKLALAVVLAAATVAAYVGFPNPLDRAAGERAAAPTVASPEGNAPEVAPAGGGEST